MSARRSPLQIVVLTIAVGCGILIGAGAIGSHVARDAGDRARQGMPDILLEGVAPSELAQHGFHLSGKEPRSWSDISVRVFQDQRGTVTLVRCQIAPDEVDSLFHFPDGSRRPLGDQPPADWPWGAPGDPFQVPTWWRPRGGHSRLFEHFVGPDRGGLFANYDPATKTLHFWQWVRHDWTVSRTSPLDHLVADELAMAIEAGRRRDGIPVAGDGWIRATGLTAADCALPPGRLPAGISGIDAALFPLKHQHRYLLAVHGLDEERAWSLVGELPLRTLAVDGPVPMPRWAFAALPGVPSRLPDWFSPGPGRRAAHCLITVGLGMVESGRWVAFDAHTKTLYVWDWEGPQPQGPDADLCR